MGPSDGVAVPTGAAGLLVRGVSLLYESPPLTRFHFALDPRLTVLYGLNGAGKSQVLQVLAAALGGGPGHHRPVLHVDLTPHGWMQGEVALLADRLVDDARLVTDLAPDQLDDDVDAYVRRVFPLLKTVGLTDDVAGEIAAQHAACITWDADRPLAHVAVRFDGTAPLTEALLDRLPTPWDWQGADLFRPQPDLSAPVIDASPDMWDDHVAAMRPATVCDRVLDYDDTLGEVVQKVLAGQTASAAVTSWVQSALRAVEGGYRFPEEDEEPPESLRLRMGRSLPPPNGPGRIVAWMRAHPAEDCSSLSPNAYEVLAPWVGQRLRAAWEVARRGGDPAPPWVSFPILQLGELRRLGDTQPLTALRHLSDQHNPEDTLASTLAGLLPEGVLRRDPSGRPVLDPLVEEILGHLESRIGDFAAELASDAPTVAVELEWPHQLSESFGVRVQALDPLSAQVVPLEALSAAQRRWLSIATTLASSELLTCSEEAPDADPDNDTDGSQAEAEVWPTAAALLLDEPDANLHSAARAQVPAALADLAVERGLPVVVATHAVEFLTDPRARLVHVTRGPGGARLTDITEVLEPRRLATLGLSRAEALALTRVFVIVEGEHDRAVLRGWLQQDYLAPARARILAMRGDYNLVSILDSQLLLQGSDAGLVVVLDRQAGYQRLAAAWQQARNLAAEHTRSAAIARLQRERTQLPARGRGDDVPPAALLHELMLAALDQRLEARLDVVVLSTSDICQQLPINAFQGAGTDWAAFDHQRRREGADLKKLLARLTGVDVHADLLYDLTQAHPATPEMHQLGRRIMQAARLSPR